VFSRGNKISKLNQHRSLFDKLHQTLEPQENAQTAKRRLTIPPLPSDGRGPGWGRTFNKLW